VFQPQPGVVVRGHTEIRSALGELLSLAPTLTSTIEQVLEADGVALVVNAWTMTLTAAGGAEVHQTGRSADVLRRQADGTWRVLIDKP
jgi:ketosteroid isomerase-like protein